MAQMYCNPGSDSILEGMSEDVAEDVKNLLNQGQVHTHGRINNATWETIKYADSHVWDGESPNFPEQIKACDSGEFDHTGTKRASSAAVVYSFQDKANQECDWIMAWYNPSKSLPFPKQDTKSLPFPKQDRVYTDIIRHRDHYTKDDWEKIFDQLKKSKNYATVKWNGYVATVTLNNDEFKATLGLADHVA